MENQNEGRDSDLQVHKESGQEEFVQRSRSMEEEIASSRPRFRNVSAKAQMHHEVSIHQHRSLSQVSNVNEVVFVQQECVGEQAYLLHPVAHPFTFEVIVRR